ncbi:MAG: hypothetical protein IIB23_00820 [Chloroflexi bacterium]|nr:hypothetical protein [Chloroflexota bacterium]
MYKKAGQLTTAVVVVAVVGIAAFFIASRFAGGDAVGQATQDDNIFLQELRDRLDPTIQADRALPPARGRYGDFVLVGMDPSEPRIEIPCSRSYDRSVNDMERVQQSELYSPLFNENPEVYDCTDGTIGFIGGYIQHEVDITEFGRYHFVGQPIVNSEAPRERLELATIGGRPALIEHGLDISPFPAQARIFVIERTPSAQQPGIMLVVFTPTGVVEGIKLSEELMR